MRAVLVLGSERVVRPWEFDALEMAVAGGLEIVTVLHCTNDRRPPLKFEHTGYYALALAARRGEARRGGVDPNVLLSPDVQIIRFESEWKGAWQRIPAHVSERLENVDVVVKFGMNLLRDPDSLPSKHGVISYHHGDPEKYRGRPAGFYELEGKDPVMGVIVQKLNNTLDGGDILAKAYSRVVPTSYTATLNDASAIGAPLLSQALESLKANSSLPRTSLGKNYTLPTNRQVVRTVVRMTTARLRWLSYGIFREKRWKVAYVPGEFEPEVTPGPDYSELKPIELPEGYTFAADPCAYHDGRLFAEVMHAGRGRGEIFAYENGVWKAIDLPVEGGHLSYPQVIEHGSNTYLFPEMAQVGSPSLFQLDKDQLTCIATQQLVGLEEERLTDGTLLEHEGRWYLFGGRAGTAGARLELWSADNPVGPWTLHPMSPVCLDPRSARMGGPILHAQGNMYRVGQDGSIGYGQGVTIKRIEKLSLDEYKEVQVRPFAVKGAYGPHTVLTAENGYWIDYYTDRTTPLAGLRRIRALMK